MNRDHAAFAAELRADAAALRGMAETLDRRADEQARLAGTGPLAEEPGPVFPSAFSMNMDEAAHHAWMRRIRRREARQPAPIDEDNCAFGLRYVGSALAPTLDYT